MESHAQSVEDNLIESLSFKLRPGASYVTDRRSVTYFPQGGNSYSPAGVKVIKLMLTGDSWMDPSTVKLFMNIKNDSAADITPRVAGPWGMFRRLRILCGGQICEDLDLYGRLHEQFHMMKPTEKRENDAIEGFGEFYVALSAGAERVVAFTPFSGLLSQDKYLPIRYSPLQVELEVVSSADEAFSGASPAFTLSDVQLKADLVTLDNSLDNEYAQHLLSGKSLPINFSTFTTASQVITNLNTTVNVSRALTRLKGVYVSLSTDAGGAKEVNNFYHPMGFAYDKSKELSFEMQIGAKKYPEYPIQSAAEAFYQLRKSLGLHARNALMDIRATEYRTNKFVIGIDTEKVLGASFSGHNSKSGDLTVLRLKPLGDATLTGNCKMHYVLHYDSIMQISDGGVSILE